MTERTGFDDWFANECKAGRLLAADEEVARHTWFARPAIPAWTDAERAMYRMGQKKPQCPVCCVDEGSEHFPTCPRGAM